LGDEGAPFARCFESSVHFVVAEHRVLAREVIPVVNTLSFKNSPWLH